MRQEWKKKVLIKEKEKKKLRKTKGAADEAGYPKQTKTKTL